MTLTARHERAGTVRATVAHCLTEAGIPQTQRTCHERATCASQSIGLRGACWLACATRRPRPAAGLDRIEHIVVIYAENRSFDNLYGLFPGANGIANATPAQYTQVDYDGKPLPHLPPVWKGKEADPAFPQDLPNRPFRIDAPPINLPLRRARATSSTSSIRNQEQINGGRNNRFAAVSDAGALGMGYYDGSQLPMWKWAQEYTLADNFFMGAFGGSYLNHFWLICACTPRRPEAAREPASHNSTIADG